MMHLIHGEHEIHSRQQLLELITTQKAAGHDVTRFNANQLNLAILEQALGGETLFESPRTIVIEELHSLPKSKRKDALLQLLAHTLSHASNQNPTIILWEKRALTPSMLKPFKTARITEHKLSKSLFAFLDSLSGQSHRPAKNHQLSLLARTLQEEDAFFVFVMLLRQVRLLMQAQDGTPLKGAPFMQSKLKKQAQTFTKNQLLNIHQKLQTIDQGQKTGSSIWSMAQELDLLLIRM